MAVSVIYSHFCRKSRCVQDLEDSKTDRPIRVQVSKVIELTQAQYQHFSSHLLQEMPVIAANRTLTDCDSKGVNHCLPVTARNRGDGILVDCQGFNCARYAAYVSDKSALELQDVPVDHYNPKPRHPRRQQKR